MASSRKRQPPANAAPEEANAALNEPRRTPGRFRAIVYAALVHAIVVAALIIGFSWSSAPTVAPENTIQAVVTEDPEKKKQEEERRRRQEEERKAEVEAQKKEEERRLEARRKQAEAEKQKQAEAKRKEEERKKTEVEAQRKRAEAEARKKREEEVQSRKVAEDSLKQQLADEERARAQAANAARAASELKKYEGRIQQKVLENWVRVGDDPRLQCVVRVRLAAGGVVLEANIVKGSGNAEFDRSVPPAVHKASPLPLPPEAELFEYYREITFTFRPPG